MQRYNRQHLIVTMIVTTSIVWLALNRVLAVRIKLRVLFCKDIWISQITLQS
jgi:hypothetical protein